MNHRSRTERLQVSRYLPGLIALLLFTGCAAVGPDYVPPGAAAPGKWHAEMQGGLSAREMDPQALAQWWTALKDPILSSLMERAVEGNLDLQQARARVREARASRNIARAGLFPTITASGSATSSRGSEERGGGRRSDLYVAGLDAGWELDIFGGVRRSVEAATADLEASREDLHDVLVSLLAEVALNYIDMRTFQARLATTEANLKAQEESLQLTRWRYQGGLATELAVEQASYNLESARSQIPTLRTGHAGSLNRLAVLLGLQPGTLQIELEREIPVPVPPRDVAVGVPADVLRRRPDVRRTERQLAAQTAQIGVATAELYPKFNLGGSIGLEALSFGSLFSAGNHTYRIGPNISWPIFNAGAIRGNIAVQSARQEQTLLQYQSAVLGALEEVENALVAYAQEQNRRQALKTSVEAAKRAVALATIQYQGGQTDFINVIDAQRSLLSLQDQLEQSAGAVTSNLVRLYKALGGGWTSLAPAAT